MSFDKMARRLFLRVSLAVVLTVSFTHAKSDKDAAAAGKGGVDIQFVLSARELPAKKSLLGQSGPDPFVEIEYYEKKGEEVRKYSTSILRGTANPEWPDVIRVSFIDGQGQRLKFTVRDGKSGSEISHCSASLKSIFQASANQVDLQLVGPNQTNGRLIINTLISDKNNDETVERLASSKTNDKSLLINLDKKPKAKKKKVKKPQQVEVEEEDDEE